MRPGTVHLCAIPDPAFGSLLISLIRDPGHVHVRRTFPDVP
jgi:hypothetical protein